MTEDYVSDWVNCFVPASELLERADDDKEWIVRGLLRAGTYMVVFGREGTGKSRILYQLAEKLSSGGSWFGYEVLERGPVVFLQADMAPKESKGILQNAFDAGILSDNIYFPDRYGTLDVLTKEGYEVLQGIQERLQPKLVIIDTATDVYRAKDHHESINDSIQDCVQAFRTAFPDAGLVFVLHERKVSQYLQAKGVEDEDSALGGGEWSRKASGVIRIKAINDIHILLDVRKTRDILPYKKITLARTEHGFFEVEPRYVDPLQALALFTSSDARDVGHASNVEKSPSVTEICKKIERESGGKLKVEAIRKAYQRAKKQGIVFPWEVGTSDVPE